MASVMRRPSREIMRWDPTPDFQSLNALMGRLFEGMGEAPTLMDDAFMPAADMEETDGAFIIEVELPGVKKGDIDVALSGRRLTISGERKEPERTGVLRRRVRNMGAFRFEMLLPSDVDEESVTAALKDGVLNVAVAKRSGEKLRHVEIK